MCVNGLNNDIKNNRLKKLLKVFCNTFNNFINLESIMETFIFSFDDKKINKIKNKNLLGGKKVIFSEMGKLGFNYFSDYNYYFKVM